MIKSVERDGFETEMLIADAAEEYCVFQVMPVDKDGKETRFSDIVVVRECEEDKWLIFTPMIAEKKG